jgi:hypothetical protein
LSADALELIGRLEASQGAICRSCRQPLCAHQVLASIALGAGGAPRCLPCLSTALEQTVPELVDSLRGYFRSRDCFNDALAWANRMQAGAKTGRDCCLLKT